MLIDVPPEPVVTGPEIAIVHQINRLRLRLGLPRVHITRRLGRAARRHTLDMLRNGRLTHEASNGASFVDRMRGVPYWSVGETLAWVPSALGSDARSVVYAWLRSPAHKAQLLERRYWRVGVSRMTGRFRDEEGVAVTVNFSTRY